MYLHNHVQLLQLQKKFLDPVDISQDPDPTIEKRRRIHGAFKVVMRFHEHI